MTLTAGEVADLNTVTDLLAAYHAQGLVMGDLAHDGTVEWEAGAE